jgi:hypothetical protein
MNRSQRKDGVPLIDLYDRMKMGTKKQQDAFTAIMELDILNELSTYNPVLCGTLPIGIEYQKEKVTQQSLLQVDFEFTFFGIIV